MFEKPILTELYPLRGPTHPIKIVEIIIWHTLSALGEFVIFDKKIHSSIGTR